MSDMEANMQIAIEWLQNWKQKRLHHLNALG
jgi:hypothetical protein